jgi:ABC-type amino acid transport substrate-binding protein
MTKIANLWAGPGTGKSTTAADVFAEMKWQGFEVELVTEYAKDLVWEGHHNIFEDQFYISAQQNRRMERLVGKVDYIITDCPLMLCEVYMDPGYPREMLPAMLAVFNRYDNFNVVLNRKKAYNPNGRNQDENGARVIDRSIREMLERNNIPVHLEVDGVKGNKYQIIEALTRES